LETGALFDNGKYLEAVECELYQRFLTKLRTDDWNACNEIVRLLEGLSII
jgi:hypothetical protein